MASRPRTRFFSLTTRRAFQACSVRRRPYFSGFQRRKIVYLFGDARAARYLLASGKRRTTNDVFSGGPRTARYVARRFLPRFRKKRPGRSGFEASLFPITNAKSLSALFGSEKPLFQQVRAARYRLFIRRPARRLPPLYSPERETKRATFSLWALKARVFSLKAVPHTSGKILCGVPDFRRGVALFALYDTNAS